MVEIVQDFIPPGRRNRPGIRLDGPRYICVHSTANVSRGADALAHARYLKSDAAASRPASWHFSCDDKRIVQHLPLDEVAWHAGDGANGPGNRSSIAIEICENADGDRAKAIANAAWLVAKLLRDFGLTPRAVVPHKHWTGKHCPRILLGHPADWEAFMAQVRQHATSPPDDLRERLARAEQERDALRAGVERIIGELRALLPSNP